MNSKPFGNTGSFMSGARWLSDLDTVQRIEEGEKGVRYKNVMLLSPGEWTDAGSGQQAYYPPETIKQYADEWEDNTLNFLTGSRHEPDNQVAQVGIVDTDTATTDSMGNLYADLVLHGRTSASDDAIGLMDLALETEGEQGVGGPSVEIAGVEGQVDWDADRGMNRLEKMPFTGCALVNTPASKPVAMEEQLADRNVALASGEDSDGSVRLMQRSKPPESNHPPMQGIEKRLASIEEKQNEIARRLEDGDGEDEGGQELADLSKVTEIMSMAVSEGFDPEEANVQELVQFATENLDLEDEQVSALEDALGSFMETVDGDDPAEVSAAALASWLEEQEGDGDEGGEEDEEGDEEGGEDEGDGEEEGDEEPEEELSDVKDQLGAITETLESVADSVNTLAEANDEQESRLSALEDEPNEPRTSAEHSRELSSERSGDETKPRLGADRRTNRFD